MRNSGRRLGWAGRLNKPAWSREKDDLLSVPTLPRPAGGFCETAAEKGRVKVTQPEPNEAELEGGEIWRGGEKEMGQEWGRDRNGVAKGERPRRGAERDGEIGQRGRHRETSHNKVGEG